MGDRPQVLVVTGMSGAGRSSVAKVLEDWLGYTVIDNLPPHLIGEVMQHHDVTEGRRRLAVVIDSRGGLPSEALEEAVNHLLGQGVSTMLLFLDAEDEALIGRYEENRRPHPVRRGSLADSISAERHLLGELREMSDVVIDTTDLNVHQLRERVTDLFSESQPERPMHVSVTSFGYKHGIPRDADLLFDVRFLPNPHWVPALRPLRGTDTEVRDYVFAEDDARQFFSRICDLLGFLIPRFQAEGKSYLAIGIGCTGGHHRSVAIAQELGEWLESEGIACTVRHRDVGR
ncbi:MAG: RNase adapter RapZ [Acidimicrobiia bacterium]